MNEFRVQTLALPMVGLRARILDLSMVGRAGRFPPPSPLNFGRASKDPLPPQKIERLDPRSPYPMVDRATKSSSIYLL